MGDLLSFCCLRHFLLLKPLQHFYLGNREVKETPGACGVAVLLRFDRAAGAAN
jgi:hypothetical protein